MEIGLLTTATVTILAILKTAVAADLQHPDKILESKNVNGRLAAYQEGDYAHVVVNLEQGGELSFFVDDEICFLASNREDVLAIKYDEVERYFPEGRGYFPANIIRSIVTKTGTRKWIRAAGSKPTALEQNECARVLRITFIRRDRK
jgi:hypothetical protein